MTQMTHRSPEPTELSRAGSSQNQIAQIEQDMRTMTIINEAQTIPIFVRLWEIHRAVKTCFRRLLISLNFEAAERTVVPLELTIDGKSLEKHISWIADFRSITVPEIRVLLIEFLLISVVA